MLKTWKSDLYRLSKSQALYSIIALAGLLAFVLVMLIRQDIRLGISVFGNLTTFKGIEDIIRTGVQYQKGLGLLSAILISIFIGQEYLWKTWQHKWIAVRSRVYIYLSKALLSSAVSAAIFMLFEIIVLLCSGQMKEMVTVRYVSMMICGSLVYASLGTVLSMFSMLIRNSTASAITCLGYILFSETLVAIIRNICNLSDMTAMLGDFFINHSIYGMSLRVSGVDSLECILPFFVNSVVIISLSMAIGICFFRKYEL